MVVLYLGPGIATGTLLIAIGIVAIVLVFLFTFFWFPIKRFIKRIKNRK